MILSDAEKETPFPYIVIPSPGAVCPAIVRFLENTRRDLILIIPETSNIITRLGLLIASRKEPSPESFRLVTW